MSAAASAAGAGIAISGMIGELSRDSIVLISTHVVSDIEFIAREVILLQQGRSLKKGSAAKLCQELEGKVFDVSLQDENLEAFDSDHQKIVTGYVCDCNGILPYWLFLAAGIAADLTAGILFISLLDKLAQKLKVRNFVLAVSLVVIFAGLLCAAL